MAAPAHKQESKQLLEAQLQATLDVIPAYTWYANRFGGLTFVNKRLADYLGLPKEHPLRFGIDTGADWDSHIPLLHPDDHEETRRIWSTCLRTSSAGEVTFRVRNAEGQYRWFLSRAEPLRASDGTPLYWIGVNLDIEERKQAEFELRRSKGHLADAQRLSRTGSFAWSPTRDTTYFSEECYRLLGFEPNGNPPAFETIVQRIHPDDQDYCRELVAKALHDKADIEFDYRIIHPDKTVRNIHCLAHTVLDQNGDFAKFVGTVIDVTEQVRAEAVIRKQEAELREVVDTIPAIAWSALPDGSNSYVNSRWVEYSGISADHAAGSGWKVACHPDDLQQHLAKWLASLATGNPHENEVRFRRSDGEYR